MILVFWTGISGGKGTVVYLDRGESRWPVILVEV